LKRKVVSLENDRQFLIRLVERLRTGRQNHVTDLLDHIRSSSSLQEIKLFLDSYVQQTETEPTPQMTEMFVELERLEQTRQPPLKILAARRLSDIPLVIIPAKPWTTVTDDDNLVSHLISLWLTWHYPWSHCIDPAIFIKAMQSRYLQSSLCSPFLVNAILAEASVSRPPDGDIFLQLLTSPTMTKFFSDDPEACAIRDDIRTKGNHFYTEAKKLLDDEEGRMSIPTIQGLGIMFEW
jgi:hypothetical protein